LGGRIIAAFTAILGIGMFALPAGILSSGFLEELQQRREELQQGQKEGS
jgi:voltage-gated potassium channel